MKKRIRIAVGVLLALVMVAILAIPEYRLTLLGYVRGENRFEGRPTGYWHYKVKHYVAKRNHWPPTISYWNVFLAFISTADRNDKPGILWGNPGGLPVLIDLIKQDDLEVVREAYRTLMTLGPQAEDARQVLEEHVNGNSEDLRFNALMIFGSLGPAGIQDLIKALGHHSARVRIEAAHLLQLKGPSAKGAVPDLVHALEDINNEVRIAAADALIQIDPKAAEKVEAFKFARKLLPPLAPGTEAQAEPITAK